MTPSRLTPRRRSRALAASLAVAGAVIALSGCGSSSPKAASSPKTFTSHAFASGVSVTFAAPTGKASAYQPDDITRLGSSVYVAFQNDVGPQGEPTPTGEPGTGNRDSTIVEFSSAGKPVKHWNVLGHVDGLTADSAKDRVIASANEDANARLYAINPASPQPIQYRVPPLPSHGGLDAISFWHGMLLISASAPGTTGKAAPQASYPAVYVTSLNSSTHTVSVRGLFGDEASAARTDSGATGTTTLALTDPDSNAVVPADASQFGGDFELTSQADKEQIFVADASAKRLSVRKLSGVIDDSAWASGPSGALYATDATADLIWKITGPFERGAQFVSVTPCDAANAPPEACPAPPAFPPNYLGIVNESTGAVSKFKVTGATIQPKGMLFVP